MSSFKSTSESKHRLPSSYIFVAAIPPFLVSPLASSLARRSLTHHSFQQVLSHFSLPIFGPSLWRHFPLNTTQPVSSLTPILQSATLLTSPRRFRESLGSLPAPPRPYSLDDQPNTPSPQDGPSTTPIIPTVECS